jgi:hypothetical protein
LLDEGSGVEDATADEGVEETDPYAIPEDGIDEAYVERVLEAIFEVNREALALTLESEVGDLAPFEAEERLQSIFAGEYGARQVASLHEVAASSSRREVFLEPPGRVRTEVTRVARNDEDCVVVERRSDFSDVLVDPPEPRKGYLALAPRNEVADHNPTPWVLVDGSVDTSRDVGCNR